MPTTPKRPCRHPRCLNLCEKGVYCEDHRKLYSHDALRGGATVRGYDADGERQGFCFFSSIHCAWDAGRQEC